MSLRGTRAVLMTRACAFWEGARYQSDVVVPPIVTTLSVPLASLAPAHAHARPGAGELGQDRRPRVPGRDGRNSERNEGPPCPSCAQPERKAICNRRMSLLPPPGEATSPHSAFGLAQVYMPQATDRPGC